MTMESRMKGAELLRTVGVFQQTSLDVFHPREEPDLAMLLWY